MPLDSNSKAWLRVGEYMYPYSDLYAVETPFYRAADPAVGVASIGTRHVLAGRFPKPDDLEVDSGGSGVSSYPIGG